VCRQCRGDARFVERRKKTFVSLFGPIKVYSPYYHCRACGTGRRSWDERLRLGTRPLTPAAEEISAMAGVLDSFADGAQRVLQKMAGVRLSESTIQRTTEAAGARLAQHLQAENSLGPSENWRWQKDAAGRSCAYVSLDATGVRQQGPGGTRAEGKMSYVAMVYNARSEHDSTRPPPRQVRYLSGFYDFQTLGRELHQEALAVGWINAEQQIAISDGGVGLENFFRTYFPKAECILDFWHAKEYLVELGQSLYPGDEPTRAQWTDHACHRLKHEGGATVRAWLETLDLSAASTEVREQYRKTVQYYRNHERRMDYPRYVGNGWQIGSGPVESACKTVVGNRLKGGGMRWGHAGADAVCHLRGLYLSEACCWDAFWDPPRPPASPQN
jgi:hypothetical protein